MKDLDEVISSLKCVAIWLDNDCYVKESVAEVMLDIKMLESVHNKYKELKSSNNALVHALGVAHEEINELVSKVEAEQLTTAAHKRSQGYAFDDLVTLTTKYKEAQTLLDACYEVVELWDCQAPSQIEWKREWLEGAMRHGAGGN